MSHRQLFRYTVALHARGEARVLNGWGEGWDVCGRALSRVVEEVSSVARLGKSNLYVHQVKQIHWG